MVLNNDNATFIGQETGDGHEFYTAGNMAFPNGSGLRPHHRVAQSQADFIQGKDTVMQFSLDLIKQSGP